MISSNGWNSIKSKWIALLEWKHLPWICSLIGMLLVAPSINGGFFYDDWWHKEMILESKGEIEGKYTDLGYASSEHEFNLWDVNYHFFRFADGLEKTNQYHLERGSAPWWMPLDIKCSFWRPLTALTHWIDYSFWPDSPKAMHLHSIIWYGIAILAVSFLFKGLIKPPWVAGLAILLFSFNETHAYVIGWISNRSALLIVVSGVLSILAHHYWRSNHWKPGCVLAPCMFLVSLLFGEGGVATSAYITAYAICLDKGNLRKRTFSIVPYLLILIIWKVGYGILDHGVNIGIYIDPFNEPIAFISGIFQRLPILFYFEWFWTIDWLLLLSPKGNTIFWGISVLIMAIITLFMLPVLKRDAHARFFALGTFFASLPVTAMTLPSPRLVFFASVGTSALFAIWLKNLWTIPDLYPNRWIKRIVWYFVAFIIIAQLVQSPYKKITISMVSCEQLEDLRVALTDIGQEYEIQEQDVIILNAPNVWNFAYLHAYRRIQDQPIPRMLRILASSSYPVELERMSPKSLVVRIENGFFPRFQDLRNIESTLDFAFLFNNLDEAYSSSARTTLKPGDQIKITGMTVEIIKLSDNAGPSEAKFTFANPLDSKEYRWLEYVPKQFPEIGSYQLWKMPEIGEKVIIGKKAAGRVDRVL
jgi:hypothetical protein